MNRKEMNEVISEILGIKHSDKCLDCGKPESDSRHIKYGPDEENSAKHFFVPQAIPNYCGDLNAMHIAAIWLREKGDDLYRKYNEQISCVLFEQKGGWKRLESVVDPVAARDDLTSTDAPAIVRAIAFLIVNGKLNHLPKSKYEGGPSWASAGWNTDDEGHG